MQPPWEGLIYRDEMARHWSSFQWGVEPIHCWTVDKLLWRQDQWLGICSPWSYVMGFSLKVDWWGYGAGTDDQWTIPTKTYHMLLVTCAKIKLLFSCTLEYCILRHLIRWLAFPETETIFLVFHLGLLLVWNVRCSTGSLVCVHSSQLIHFASNCFNLQCCCLWDDNQTAMCDSDNVLNGIIN